MIITETTAAYPCSSSSVCPAKSLARFLKLHPHNIGQKTKIVIVHFQSSTRHKIGGHAKAMIITSSRIETVRYKQSLDQYTKSKEYDIKSLVAFSGVVTEGTRCYLYRRRNK